MRKRRRRLHPPWIPGFWALVAFLALVSSVLGYYYLLGTATRLERRAEKPDTPAAGAAGKSPTPPTAPARK